MSPEAPGAGDLDDDDDDDDAEDDQDQADEEDHADPNQADEEDHADPNQADDEGKADPNQADEEDKADPNQADTLEADQGDDSDTQPLVSARTFTGLVRFNPKTPIYRLHQPQFSDGPASRDLEVQSTQSRLTSLLVIACTYGHLETHSCIVLSMDYPPMHLQVWHLPVMCFFFI